MRSGDEGADEAYEQQRAHTLGEGRDEAVDDDLAGLSGKPRGNPLLKCLLGARREIAYDDARHGQQHEQDGKHRHQEVVGQEAGEVEDPVVVDLAPECNERRQPAGKRPLFLPPCDRPLAPLLAHSSQSFGVYRPRIAAARAASLGRRRILFPGLHVPAPIRRTLGRLRHE